MRISRSSTHDTHLSTWRQQRDQGQLTALAPKKRGRPSRERNPLARKVTLLERQKGQLERRLKQAELLLEVQKKVSEILGIPLETLEDEED